MFLLWVRSLQGWEKRRQAVHDIIKRCDKTLKDYEDKLHLIEKFLSIKKDVERIEVVAGDDDVKLLAHKILESL